MILFCVCDEIKVMTNRWPTNDLSIIVEKMQKRLLVISERLW